MEVGNAVARELSGNEVIGRSADADKAKPGATSLGCLAGRVRGRSNSLFFFTIILSSFYEGVRQDFLDSFENVVCYCIGVERSTLTGEVSHLHAVIKFSCGYYLKELKDYIVALWGASSEVEKCRSLRNSLKYVSKEDMGCIYNVSVSKLSLAIQLKVWADGRSEFSCNDPFVILHYNKWRFLEKFFLDYKRSQIKVVKFLKYDLLYGNWADSVIGWWNKGVMGGFKTALYLWGETGIGKTSLIERLIGKNNMDCVYMPISGQFAFGDFCEKFKLVLFEEFELELWSSQLGLIKRLCEGRKFAVDVKYGYRKEVCFKGPVIFVSNFEKITDMAVRRRLHFVCGLAPFWGPAIVKTEISEDAILQEQQEVLPEEILLEGSEEGVDVCGNN